MIIKIPYSFSSEKKYVIDTVFRDFMGLEFQIDNNSESEYEILIANQNSIIIEDHFFSRFNDGLGYLKKENVPEKISFSQNPFTKEKDIPVIFGLPEVYNEQGMRKTIHCKIDIIGGIFFMLTRWEEYVQAERDEYGRFPESLCHSTRNGINRRPVVNEYIEMLWNMLQYIGYQGDRKKTMFEYFLTHDVDHVIRYKNIFKLFRILTGDILVRRKPGLIITSTRDFFKIKFGLSKDNYDTFDYLMDQSEKINTKSHFFFISQEVGAKEKCKENYSDFRYDIFDPLLQSILQNIRNRGHKIGIHGSYDSFNNMEIFTEEVGRMRKIAGEIRESRQHYLRFSPPLTWFIQDQNNIKLDSTLGFNEEIGFRCGTCNAFPVFDFLKRKSLELVELPLSVMDGGAVQIAKNPEDFFSQVCSLIDVVKKYEGKFVLLWHTNSFNVDEWYPFQGYYEKIIEYLNTIRCT